MKYGEPAFTPDAIVSEASRLKRYSVERIAELESKMGTQAFVRHMLDRFALRCENGDIQERIATNTAPMVMADPQAWEQTMLPVVTATLPAPAITEGADAPKPLTEWQTSVWNVRMPNSKPAAKVAQPSIREDKSQWIQWNSRKSAQWSR